jgi:hypothetical protein
MARRLCALFGILVLVGLALALMWRIYVHHLEGVAGEEPTVVTLLYRAA